MPAIGQVLLSSIIATAPMLRTSDAAIGVNRTFDPDVITPQGVARWVDRSSGIAVGFPSMTLSVRKPGPGSRNFKVTAVLTVPTLETLGTSTASGILPANLVGYNCTARLEFTLPERSTAAERTVLLNLVRSALVSTINASDDVPTNATGSPIDQAVKDLASVY